MDIRTHLGRPLDWENGWNKLVVVLTVVAALAGLALVAAQDRDVWLPAQAAGTTFLAWALTRELDPDRQVTALIVAALGGAWALGGAEVSLLPMAALVLAARIVAETTGRRPLTNDLIAMVLLASIASITALGWVAGFGLAVALYVDDRLALEHNRQAVIAALVAALGSSAVASLMGALPRALPSILPLVVVVIGMLALLAVLREPPAPISMVDSRKKTFLRADRLHASRSMVGVLILLGSLLADGQMRTLAPLALALVSSLASSEVERLQRKSR